MSGPVVDALRARTVEIPMAEPVETAGGVMSTTPVVLIDVRDSEGLCGRTYLRTYSSLAVRALAVLLEDLAELVVGRPVVPEELPGRAPHTLRLLGSGGLVGFALAGLDMALWDLRAQAAERSLADLLGATVDKVPAYASLRSRDPRRAAEEAEKRAREGFRAVKVKLGGQPLEADRGLVQAVRSGAGPNVAIMADYNQSLSVAEALSRAQELDALELAWIEEPTTATDMAGHARISEALSTPVQLGENLEAPQEVRRSIGESASDHLMLDAMKIGGVTGWMQACAMAGGAGKKVSSHAFPEYSVHLLAATPTAHWLEHLDHLAPIREAPLDVVDGYVCVPGTHGAGLRWDERAVSLLLDQPTCWVASWSQRGR
jgi:mandelate racemase